MSAPTYVPSRPNQPRTYTPPPRRPGSWRAERPGEVIGAPLPTGRAFGNPGPDQGYVLKLAERFRDRLVLAPGEDADDVLAGACAIALRRASLFGRAPVIDDVRIALTLFGYLGEAPDELVSLRHELFDELHHSTIHYFDALELANSVPEATLRMSVPEVEAACAADWKAAIGR